MASGGEDKAKTSYRKAVKQLESVQKSVHKISNTLTSGSLTTAQGRLGEVSTMSRQVQETLDFPTQLRERVGSFGETIMSVKSKAELLKSVPFTDSSVGALLRFLNAAAKPVNAIKDAARQAEEMTVPAKGQCDRAVGVLGEATDKVDWLQRDMGRVTNMVDKFVAAGKNTLRAAEAGGELMEVAEKFGCAQQSKLCMAGMAKSQFNSEMMQSAIQACHAVSDSMQLMHGCSDKMVNLKDTMEDGKNVMSREVNVVGDKVDSVKGQMHALMDDLTSFNLSGVSEKCAALKDECDSLMNVSSNGESLKRKVENKVKKPLDIVETLTDAVKSLLHTLQEQTTKSEEAEKKTRAAPSMDDGKPDLTHMQGAMKEVTLSLRTVVDTVAPILGIELDPGLFEVLDDENSTNTATGHANEDTLKDDQGEGGSLEDMLGMFASKLGSALNQD
eukprot:GEMP01025753.1.p1 GENE.GEMP01025753.1~~GEMP01025753.1.p1  ORF type:complete len:445 (+),score=143.61 GEMP01025753.1:180-1514(+)